MFKRLYYKLAYGCVVVLDYQVLIVCHLKLTDWHNSGKQYKLCTEKCDFKPCKLQINLRH